MKTKRYRAGTMREVLELVKTELGEEALVLDTKRVRAGGFLGVGAHEMYEVSVACPAGFEVEDAAQSVEGNPVPLALPSIFGLNQHAATPREATRQERAVSPTFAALAAARAYAKETTTTPMSTTPDEMESQDLLANSEPVQFVEIAETAPRVVHQHTRAVTPSPASDIFEHADIFEYAERLPEPPTSNTRTAPHHETNTPKEAAPAARALPGSEVERLHAEMRELKFMFGRLVAGMPAANVSAAASLAAPTGDEEFCDPASPLFPIFCALTSAGLAPELAKAACESVPAPGDDDEGDDALTLTRARVAAALAASLNFGNDPLAARPGAPGATVVALIGPTGVGKTTTIAKLAARAALRERRRVELITLDTYRIGAVEQLKTYAEIIGVNCRIARSVLELDAMTRQLPADAVALIDTVGRSPHDLADQLELADYLRANGDIRKCLVLQATTNPGDAVATAARFALYGAEQLIITKLDETLRPGTAVEIARGASQLPLAYLCAGQRVPEDLQRAAAATFAAHIARADVISAATTTAGSSQFTNGFVYGKGSSIDAQNVVRVAVQQPTAIATGASSRLRTRRRLRPESLRHRGNTVAPAHDSGYERQGWGGEVEHFG